MDATKCAPTTKWAIRFLALTAARQIDVRRATWDQFDVEAVVWVKPAESMTGKGNRVLLSVQALDVFGEARADARRGGLVFPGSRPGRCLATR